MLKLLFAVSLLIVIGCDKAPTPTAFYSSQKPVDIEALGGLLKGQWFSFLASRAGDHLFLEIWILEVNTRSGHPDQFEYRIIRVFEKEIDLESGRKLQIAYLRNDEDVLERGNINIEGDELTWETIEQGWLRPIQDNGYGHIVFDKRYNDVPVEISIMRFRIYTDQSVVVWDDELVFKQWDVLGDVLDRRKYDLNDQEYIRCTPQQDFFLCGYEF